MNYQIKVTHASVDDKCEGPSLVLTQHLDPPEGQKWHRTDWTEEMLPEICRPLLHGEKAQLGDCFLWFGEWKPIGLLAFNVLDQGSFHHRTTRPLPTT